MRVRVRVQYPLIAVDSAVPITRLGGSAGGTAFGVGGFGAGGGHLQVLLAMGTERQLLTMKQLHTQQMAQLHQAMLAMQPVPECLPYGLAREGGIAPSSAHKQRLVTPVTQLGTYAFRFAHVLPKTFCFARVHPKILKNPPPQLAHAN